MGHAASCLIAWRVIPDHIMNGVLADDLIYVFAFLLGGLAFGTVPFVLVFTKTDKATPEAVEANITAFTARIAGWFEQLPAIFKCSATAEQGRQDLLGVIDEAMKAIQAESEKTAAALEDLPAPSRKAKATRKSRPDLARPW